MKFFIAELSPVPSLFVVGINNSFNLITVINIILSEFTEQITGGSRYYSSDI